MRRIAAVCCAFCLALPLACQAASSPPSHAVLPSRAVNKAVAVVNGEMITQFDLELASTPAMMRERVNPRDPSAAGKMQEIMRATLETMITDILIVQEAERLKISATDADVQGELKQMVESTKMPEDELFRQLALQGMDKPSVLDRLRRRVLQQRLMANMVGRKVVVTKDEIAKYFEQHASDITTGGWVEFAVLVYSPQVKAADWAARMKAGKVSFEDAVRQVSVGPNRAEGGRLPQRPWDGVLPQLRTRLERLEPGQVSEVFTMEGLDAQIKLVAEEKGRQFTTLEEAAPVIVERLRAVKTEERYKEYMAQLRAKALVEIRL